MTEPLTADELAEIRRLATDFGTDWMPQDGWPIRGGLSSEGVIDGLLATLEVAESFEGRLEAALIEYLHTVSSYIDFSATCGRGNTDHDHREAEDLVRDLAATDDRLRSG